jgi:glyoxylase-like metal-dependent hydrolase (beta-lactamase superfamily II)
MRVHHLSCATLCPVSARLINGSGSLFSRGTMVCHCWLIETDEGLVLVDTGLGTEDVADPEGRLGGAFCTIVGPPCRAEETALHQIRALGFQARDVRHIVPTHLDLDHAGGLPDFPEAEVHIYAPEKEAALHPTTKRERERYRPAHFRHDVRWAVHHDEAGEPWFGFDKVRALDRGAEVLLIPLVGHTRGHVGVAVRTASGWLLHAGDAYFHHGEMSREPTCPPGLALFQRVVAMDDASRRKNQARLRELVRKEPSVVVHSAHCPVEFERLVSAAREP